MRVFIVVLLLSLVWGDFSLACRAFRVRMARAEALPFVLQQPDDLEVVFFSNSPHATGKLLNEPTKYLGTTNAKLLDAIKGEKAEAIAAHFDLAPFRAMLALEMKGLETGMSFSLFRHLHEAAQFAVTEKFMVENWIQPEVLYFAPGHGRPGGTHSVAGAKGFFEEGGVEASIRVYLPMQAIWEGVAKSNAASKAKYIFYASCSAGLESVDEGRTYASGGQQLALLSGKPVIAPNGILENNIIVQTKGLYTRVFLREGKEEKNLPDTEPFTIFYPDGSKQKLSFDETMKLVSRPGIDNFYIREGWNPQ